MRVCFLSCLPLSFCFFFFFQCSGAHRDLHSFPTRRSSDLPRGLPWGRMGRFISGRTRTGRSGGWCKATDRKSTRLNSSHVEISYAVFCLKKKKKKKKTQRAQKITIRQKIDTEM